jgi:amino acid transporter
MHLPGVFVIPSCFSSTVVISCVVFMFMGTWWLVESYFVFHIFWQVKNPQRDLPLGIGLSLSICCSLYMLVSVVIVGLVPYYAMDPDTPISSAFSVHGMQWAA